MDSGDPAVPGPGPEVPGSKSGKGQRKSFRNTLNNNHRFLGDPISKLSSNHPPFGIHILRKYVWIVRKGFSNQKLPLLVGCSQAHGSRNLNCKGVDKDCTKSTSTQFSGTESCLVREVVNVWNRAGFYEEELISETSIRDKIVKLIQEYSRLNNRVNQKSNNKTQQEKFETDLKDFLKRNSSLFEIQQKNFVDIVNKCKRRDDKAKENDITFISKLQKGEHAIIQGEDKIFKSNVQKSEARLQRLQENIAKEEERMEKLRKKEIDRKERESMRVELESSDEDQTNDEGNEIEKDDTDKDFELDSLRKRNNSGKIKSDTRVCLTLSLDDVIQEWNPFITRFGIGNTAETSLLSQLFKIGGINIDQLPVSKTSVFKRNTEATINNGQAHRDDMIRKVENKKLVAHFDSKLMSKYTKQTKLVEKTDRLAISVSTDDKSIDFLLGVLEIPSSKGADQAMTIQSILEYFQLSENVIGLVSDTTKSNSGRFSGAVRLLSVHGFPHRATLNLMCRMHMYERHVFHIDVVLQGKTTAPVRSAFAKFKEAWPISIEKQANSSTADIVKLDWSLPEFRPGTLLYDLLQETKKFCSDALNDFTFIRGDHKYLCQLVVVYLGGEVPNFRFKQPGACHQARWFAVCIYQLVMIMTSKSSYITGDLLEMCRNAAVYITSYHAKFFLQAAMAAKAPGNDLRSFQIAATLMADMSLKKIYRDMFQALYQSLHRHKWYIVAPAIPLALADPHLTEQALEQKYKILDKLLELERPESTEFDREMSEVVVVPTLNTELHELVDEQSYLLFDALGWSQDDIHELRDSIGDLVDSPSYSRLKSEVNALQVTNVMAERNIRLVSDFIMKNHDEDKLQDCLQVVKKNRSEFPANMTEKAFA